METLIKGRSQQIKDLLIGPKGKNYLMGEPPWAFKVGKVGN